MRNDMRLESLDGTMEFSVFMRRNERFPENFSIGLNAHPKEEPGSFCLMRCNGPHGEHVNSLVDPHPHSGFHIHKAAPENTEEASLTNLYAELTDSYGSYEEALSYFVRTTNIEDAEKYFDFQKQLSLFKPQETGDELP